MTGTRFEEEEKTTIRERINKMEAIAISLLRGIVAISL